MKLRNVCAKKKSDTDGAYRAVRLSLDFLANKIKLAAFAVLLLLPLAARAATLPSPAMPESVGINIHFSNGHEKDLDLIAAAGIKVVRADFPWDKIERLQGVYDWSAYDELAANLAKRGIRPLFVLAYSNPLYEENTPKLWQGIWPYNEVMSPQRPSSVAAFARWSAEAAKHFSKYNVMWEIWNEPNIKFWRPAPDVASYSRLATATCDAIRKADSNATIIGPAAAGLPWDFIEALFKTGVLNCLDGVSVHPYRSKMPETVAADYVRLRQLIAQYAPPHRTNIPILSGEWGYTTIKNGIPLQDQADLAVRMQLVNLLNDVPLSIWYDWKNDGIDARNHENNFGIVEADLKLKPAYLALKTMTKQLAGYRLVRRIDIDNNDDYALLFANAAGHSKLVVWTSGHIHNSRIAAPPPPRPAQLTLTNWQELSKQIHVDGDWIPLELTNSPAYIAP